MPMETIGEFAALLTSLAFAVNAVILTKAGLQVGSMVSNRIRVAFALLYLAVLNSVLFGQPLPLGADPGRWIWLSLSGVIGLALGDAFLIQAYVTIGPRLGMLFLSLSTVFSAFEAWLLFRETLGLVQIIGIAVALTGTMWVILERGDGSQAASRPSLVGILFGLLGALGQGTGLVFSKQGMLGSFSPISGNVIRMFAAALALWLVTLLQRQGGKTLRALRDNPSAFKLLALVALVGPVIGVSLSLLAVQYSPVGVASMLTSLSPVFMLPIGHFVYGERLGWRPVAGTLLAMLGVALLFLA